jgi:hypothetical protein
VLQPGASTPTVFLDIQKRVPRPCSARVAARGYDGNVRVQQPERARQTAHGVLQPAAIGRRQSIAPMNHEGKPSGSRTICYDRMRG